MDLLKRHVRFELANQAVLVEKVNILKKGRKPKIKETRRQHASTKPGEELRRSNFERKGKEIVDRRSAKNRDPASKDPQEVR